MAAVQQLLASPSPSPGPTTAFKERSDAMDVDMERASQSPLMSDAAFFGDSLQNGDLRIVTIIYGQDQERIVSEFAEVLGKPCRLRRNVSDITADDGDFVIGLPAADAKLDIDQRDKSLVVVINAHCIHLGMPPDLHLSAHCDYEFLYTEQPFFRQDLSRFVSFVLGQINHHTELMAKPRTLFISTTFPDVRAALPNLDILTVGSDAVELRVDLLQEPLGNGKFSDIPSLKYVGEQVLLLRQRTELPIIFTTRCTRENGKFPMENPQIYYDYLYRAIQWGIEYIDVELWLPEEIRHNLYQRRGNSRIMSAFHDFSGTFKWPSQYAQEVYERSMKYADIIKMIAIINDHNENFELEYFRSKMRSDFPDSPPFSAVNMGEVGQVSRTLNKTFTPITHPLLPIIAAPGQLSAAEINNALGMLGQLPRKSYYGISNSALRIKGDRAPFYQKCFNELGLPHEFAVIERPSSNPVGLEVLFNQRSFGGAYLDPGLSHSSLMKHNRFLATVNNGEGPLLTEAARVIGIVDTIVVKSTPASGSGSRPPSLPSSPRGKHGESLVPPPHGTHTQTSTLIFDNASWKGILRALTRDLAPSAYSSRSAVVLASSSDDAAPVFFAMKALKITKIYTVGFRTPAALARNAPPIEQFISMESLQRARSVTDESAPFVIVSALSSEKSNLVGMLLRVFSATGKPDDSPSPVRKRVFLDLADRAERPTGDASEVAEKHGFAAYSAADVAAFTTVESMRLLVGQNVPYSFVRLASGSNM